MEEKTQVQAPPLEAPSEEPVKQETPTEEVSPEELVKQLTSTAKEELEKLGVKQKEIEDWKAKFGPIEVVFVRTDPVVYRGLSRLEWREIASMPENTPKARLDKEEVVARRCMLFPRGQDFAAPASAGFATLVFNQVMLLSKFEPSTPAIPL